MSNRRLRRFFTEDSISKTGDRVCLSPAETDHLKRILRLKEGSACRVSNRDGVQAEALVADLSGSRAVLCIEALENSCSRSGVHLFIYPAFIQRGKMDELVRQLQELGVKGVFPAETERTIVKMPAETAEKVAQRWEKIIQEAAKQSGSAELMSCDAPNPLKVLLERIPKDESRVVFHPGPESLPFRGWVEKQDLSKGRLHLFFGPEGGFSEKELVLFESHHAAQVGLGEAILKADTAVLGTAAAIKFFAYDRKSNC